MKTGVYSGDLLFTTNNQPLLKNQKNLPALNCKQHNAAKIIVTEEDVVKSNKQGFGSDIGSITNRITAMTSLLSNYDPTSVEYKTLKYRTQCGQSLQQSSIDKAKGIIPTPMPKEWYVRSANIINGNETEEEIEQKQLNQKICAFKKPYFFGYNYPSLKAEYDRQIKEINSKLKSMYQKDLDEMLADENLSDEQQEVLDSYVRKICLDLSPSTMNRICWAVEKYFANYQEQPFEEFDYSVYKSGVEYDMSRFYLVRDCCDRYLKNKANSEKTSNHNHTNNAADRVQLLDNFRSECESVCSNKRELCEILLDLCYVHKFNKSLVWELCGNVIIENMLSKYGYTMTYPEKSENGGYWCCGDQFVNRTVIFGGESYR